MPIYEYHCPRCEQEFETLVFKSDEKVECPECACAKCEKLMSGFAHRSAGGKMVTSGGSGCAGCSSTNCSSC